MKNKYSLSSSLAFFATAFIAILAILTVFTAFQLASIENATEALSDRRMTTRNVLGDIRTNLAQIRLAESDRALAADSTQRRFAERSAAGARRQIVNLRQDYERLARGVGRPDDIRKLSQALDDYLDADANWVELDQEGLLDDPARLGGELDRKYLAVRVTITGLIEENGAAAIADGQRAARSVRWMVAATTASLIAALATAVLVMRLAKRTIINPVVEITGALSRLAAGERDIRLPQHHRMREMDAMVKAFGVFQANALALQAAHEATRVAQENAQSLARHDMLTGLPNRRVFAGELERTMTLVREGEVSAYVLLIDLDRFKPVNDLHGHAAGDAVLCAVAERLTRVTREEDVVARLGGDEFAVIARFHTAVREDAAIALGNKLLAAMREPIELGDKTVSIGASIGVARYEADNEDATALLRQADLAMYRAKHDGRGAIRFFEHSMDQELRAQAALEADLRVAIQQGDIEPHFQPLVDMKTGEVYGFELLSRWSREGHGWVSPDVFIPLAEHLGLISDLTWSTLRSACRTARSWPQHIHLSINISPVQLKDTLLPVEILAILNQEKFAPSRLEVEVTESALVADMATAKAIIASLQNVGIKVSLDDFGTGYSSLYHLRELQFDKVKIDKSFVQAMCANAESEKIVDAILGLSRSLSLPTVAEGIEDAAVLGRLSEKGCEFGQGYYFGKAMAGSATAELFKDERRRRAAG